MYYASHIASGIQTIKNSLRPRPTVYMQPMGVNSSILVCWLKAILHIW